MTEIPPPPDWYDDDETHVCPHGNAVPVEGGSCYWCYQEDLDDADS